MRNVFAEFAPNSSRNTDDIILTVKWSRSAGDVTGPLKALGQVYVLECCRTAAVLLQRCCRTAAELLQIVKAHCLEMLHAKFEVCRSHRLGARGDSPKLAPPPPPPPVTPSLRKLA